jgi:hypothetical protein
MANCTKEYSEELVRKFSQREFEKIQNIEFPAQYENPIEVEKCINELMSLMTSTKSIKTISPTIRKFHTSMVKANREGKLSPYEGWNLMKMSKDVFDKFYENRLRCSDWFKEKKGENMKYLAEGYVPEFIYGIGLTTSGKYPVVTYFKPHLAKYLIEKYLGKYDTIFDPFSGYSGRMIGAVCCGKHYIGRDLCVDSVKESNEIWNFMKPFVERKLNKDIICDVAIGDACENTGKYQCLLTCSPYGNIEQWEGVPNVGYSCDKWIDICLKNYDCEKYVFVTDEKIGKYKSYVAENLENTSHWGSNTECVVVITKEQRDEIINNI